MARAMIYNEKYHDDWAWSLAIKGAIDTEIAAAFGVSVRTIHKWKKEHKSFDEALQAGKDLADAKVERALYQRATGYEYTEERTVVEIGQDGNQKPLRVEKVHKYAHPDPKAIAYWLNNRKPEMYKRNPERFVDSSIIYEIEDMDEVENDVYSSEDKQEGPEPQEDDRLPLLGETQEVHSGVQE